MSTWVFLYHHCSCVLQTSFVGPLAVLTGLPSRNRPAKLEVFHMSGPDPTLLNGMPADALGCLHVKSTLCVISCMTPATLLIWWIMLAF